MLDTIVKSFGKLWKSEGHEAVSTPKDIEGTFELWYNSLLIGILSLDQSVWTFEYAEDFKIQDEIKPLPDFPDIDKVYNSDELYPFFIQRIPSLSQPKVEETIQKEHIDRTNLVELLKRFGKISINNPYKLKFS